MRFVKYWNMRQQIFEDLWLLPMTIEGALRHDNENLALGIIEILPPDKHGRLVLYYERLRWNPQLFSRNGLVSFSFPTWDSVVVGNNFLTGVSSTSSSDSISTSYQLAFLRRLT
jgi:hypothetical protein